MKGIIKKVLSCMLVAVMFSTSIISSAFAAETEILKNSSMLNINTDEVRALDKRFDSMTHEELESTLINEFGATAEQARQLAQYQMSASIQSRKFPTKPKIGDVHKESYTINVGVDASITGVAAALVSAAGSHYLKLAQALTIAAAIMTLGTEVIGHKVRVTVSYTYGYTNDGVLGWTPGYNEYKIIK